MRRFTINPPVFFGASALVLVFVLIGAVIPDAAADFFGKIQTWVLDQFGWFYLLAVAVFVVVVLLLALTRFGRLKLGPDDSTPDFPFASWVAMLFAAGMGIGLMFFAVGEPMSHLAAPPEADPGTIAAQREAMEVTFFHWGIHAWAIYAVVGLSLAYFGYRYNLPLTVRSGLYPILKERINGPIGHAVDIFAIAGTIFGIGTSLGFGVAQINSGMDYLFGIPISTGFQVMLIAGITVLASISVITGLDKGVRRLSEVNLILAVTLMLFVLFAGSTIDLLQSLVENVGIYFQNIVGRTFEIYAYEPNSWVNGWTLFYWAWWISWSPFVGMFIARISRGRTVRQFVVAVLFIPAGFTFIWMTVFGNTAFSIDSGVADGALSEAVANDISVALFQFFDYLPMASITSGIAIILVAVFFITSSDSGSLVVDSIASGGETNTPALQRLYWTSIEGIVAAVLLLAGGLGALQTATIAAALPFTIIMLVLCWGLIKGMQSDFAAKTPAPVSTVAHRHAPELTWQRRLAMLLRTPTREDAVKFISSTARPAMEEVAREMIDAGREALIEEDREAGDVRLVVPSEGVRNFVFGARVDAYKLPVFTALDAARPKERHEVRTYFSDGSAGYDIMGLSTGQLIHDILIQFERYQSIVQQEGAALYSAAPETA